MCGILGQASVSHNLNNDWLISGHNLIKHRGPDDDGTWRSHDNLVTFLHRRLSILDLSSEGHQPMSFTDRGVTIIFNGEIYNFKEIKSELENSFYTFNSNCDTEVLLKAYAEWGTECLQKLNGMFAFAIYDEPKKCLFIARDRAGEKPIFYREESGKFFFSSELKSLLANPSFQRKIDLEALDCYLAMGYVPGSQCILKGFKKLPPAHALTFNLNNGICKTWRYWNLPPFVVDNNNFDESDLLSELESLLDKSVRQKLLADVPVGILLSGGIDSSLITAFAAQNSKEIRTFSVSFNDSKKYDEGEYARFIANHFGTQHTTLNADPIKVDILHNLMASFDEPIVDSSIIPTWMVTNLVNKYCKVALGGDGGDELFGGYNEYSRLLKINPFLGYIPRYFRNKISLLSENYLPVGFKGRNYLQGININKDKSFIWLAKYFDTKTRRNLMKGINSYSLVAEQIWDSRIPEEKDLIQRLTRMDFQNYLAEDLLVKIDRSSMLNSLELRSPFLDHNLIEFAFSKIPSSLKVTTKNKKILLKKLTKKILPQGFNRNRKQGFCIPISKWLSSGSFREFFWDTLTDSNSIFDSETVMSLLKGQDNGLINGERIYALAQFEIWRKKYEAIL